MAKSKTELHKDALDAGLVDPDTVADDFTVEELQARLSGEGPDVAWKGSLSADEPIVAPDGHVVLSQEDIDARA